jgi:putative hydrolase of the HAD superfamily
MLPKAICFDLDDTLLSDDAFSEQAWFKSCELSAGKNNSIKSQELFCKINEIRKWFWNDEERRREGSIDLFKARKVIVGMALKGYGFDNEKMGEEIVNNYARFKDELIEFFPHVEKALNELMAKRIKLALITNGNGESQRAKVNRFELEKYFKVCLIEGELGYGKPDPRVYQEALNKLQVDSQQTWMVGNDLYFDIAGAQRLGIYSVWCDYGKAGLPASSTVKPDRIINNLAELLK